MLDEYKLSGWQARVCRRLAFAFLAVAAVLTAMTGLALVAPDLLATEINCADLRCGVRGNPVSLLPDNARDEVEGSAAAAAKFAAHLDVPATRGKLLAAEAVGGLPIVALLLSVAAALSTMARRGGDDLARAIPWLRRASIAALLAVPLVPLGESLRATVLLAALRPDGGFTLCVDLNRLVLNLLLASAAFAVTWALAAGSRAGRDIAEIV